MKPLLTAVVAICLLIQINALPENEEVKDLSQSKEPVVEAEDSEPQARKERCTTCTGGFNYNFGSPNQVLAEIQAAPGAEVHTQQSFEGCSSDKGCAGIKVKDGRVIERFGNVDAFRQAAASDAGSEFTFHAAGALGNVLEGGIPNEGPYWWMNQNSPFKAGAGAGAVGASGSGGSFEKFSKSSSSFSTTGNAAGVGGLGGAGVGGLGGANAAGAGQGAAFGASLDLSGNPFLNGEFSKIAGGFAGGQEVKPASFQSSSFESSSFTSKGEVDLTKNQFGNGGANKFGASGFQGQGGFAAGGGQGAFGAGQSGFAAGSQSGQSAFGAGAGQSGQSGFGAGSGQNGYSGSNSQSAFSASSNSQSGYSGSAGSNQNGFGAGSNQNGLAGSSGQNGFAAGGQGFQNQGFASGSKFSSSGYTGSSPSPFTASTAGSNVNLIQNQQKTSEFDFEQQQQNQQNIDEVFQGTGNVHAHEHSGGELQQTCAGQGYVCVHKAQCNNGVVNTNGAGILQAKTKKQYCNIKTEICCRIEISTLSGAGGLQGSLGVGAATYSGQGAQGSQGGLFVSSNQGSSQSSNSAQGFGQAGQAGQAGQGSQAGQAGSFGSSTGSSSFESSSFGSSSRGQGTQGSQGRQGAQGAQGTQGAQGSAFGAQGQFGSNSGFGTNGFGTAGSANRGVTIESSSSSFESSSRGGSAFGAGNAGNGLAGNGGLAGNSGTAGSTNKFGAAGTFSNTNFGATGTNGVPAVPGANRFGSTTGNEVVYKQTSQSNFIETDSFTAGSEGAGIYRPGAAGLKPGIPYLPPVDVTNSGSNVVGSTAFSTTPRPFTPPRPTYLPPVTSTSAPGYLPPEVPEQTINTETRVPNPNYNEGSLILDETIQPRPKPPPAVGPSEIPSGCAAALKCTPIEFCTAEGVISNTTVILNRDQEAFRVPLTDCKDIASGTIGKCCRDPYYTDPWPTNQLGKWVPGVFGGNDGKYAPDSRGSGSIARPQVTVRPPVTGSTFLNNFRTPKPTIPPFGPNQVTPGFPATTSQSAFGQKSQFEVRGQGQFGQGGQGQFAQGGQGQFGTAGQGQASQGGQFSQGSSQFTSSSQSFGQQGQSQLGATQGQGQLGGAQLGVAQGQGQFTQQGQGQFAQGGRGQFGVGGLGQLEVQGQGAQGQFTQTSQSSSQSTTTRGQGQAVLAGQGQSVSQGFGSGIRQGQGFAVSQGAGFGVENEYSESSQRVFLQQYSAGGQCGLFNGQKPYGNRNELEVDFAEIPWQAMVLLQTNKSLLCGGVITRPDVVITSASCVDGLEAKNVLIKGGEWKLGIDDEPLPFQIVQVKNILRHPFYKRGSYINDVAILVLGENLRFAKNIYPICLPRAGETLDAYYNGAGECIVTGWGKQVLQAHLSGAIMHSLNISLINPGECQAKLSQDYPHLLEQYDQDTCACGQPTNPVNNICRVDIGSALACTTGDNHFVLRGIYSWDSGCQLGNQLAAFYKFDLEWYEWAIGLIESARFAQFSSGSAILSQNRFASQINSGVKGASGIKGGASGFGSASGIKGGASGFGGASSITGGASGFGSASGIKSGASGFGSASSIKGGSSGFGSASGIKGGASGFKGFGQIGFGGSQGQFATGGSQGQFATGGSQGQFSSGGSQFSSGQYSQYNQASKGSSFGELKGPVTNSFSSSFSEKKVFQSEPKIITYTTKPEIVTFTTKPELFTFTTKPKIVTYTTKPQIIRYETSGSGQNPQYVAPGVTFNPSFSDLVGKQHTHNAQCKCLDGQGKKK